MAFVSRFEHDVFISYANVDDDPLIPGDEASRWVRTFRNNLQTLLDQKLGRRGSASIWMDLSQLQGNQPLTADIQNGLQQTAILLVILSEGYLASDWCRQEREAFLQAASIAVAEGRLFVVHRDEIARENWPTQFGDLIGYPFYEKDPYGAVHTLAVPKPDPSQRAYYSRLDTLRTDVANKLQELQKSAAAGEQTRPATATSPVAAAELDSAEPTVFLAEVTPDLYEVREEVAAYLRQAGIATLPTKYYSRAPAAFQEESDVDLAASLVFAQLLGPWSTPHVEDLPAGYEGLQLQRAQAASLPILRWRSRELDLNSVQNQAHRRTLEADDVMAMDLEDFKRTITETLRKTQSQQQRAVESVDGDMYVLVSAGKEDMPVADALAQELDNHNIGFDIIDEATPIMDLADSDDYDGVMVIYGGTGQEWVQQRVRECRRVALKRKSNAPICGIYIGPPVEKPPLRSRPPRFFVIDSDDNQRFSDFVNALATREES